MFKIHNLINIGFPIYLVGFEILLRSLSSVNTSAFVGPTLAASGLGLLIGVIRPRVIKLDPTLEQSLKEAGISAIVRDSRDDRIIQIAWIGILLEILTWYWSCASTIKIPDSTTTTNLEPLLIGFANYIIGIVIVSFKESEK